MSHSIAEQTIQLMLVDDHALFREGLARVLESVPEFQVVGKASTVGEAIGILEAGTSVDIVILDVDLGHERGMDFMDRARQANFKGRILLVTAGVSDREAVLYVQAGAAGILHKQNQPKALCDAILKVARGEVHLEGQYLKAIFQTVDTTQPTRPRLTERDTRVMRLLLEGAANKEISAELNISESAAKASLRALFDKLGVRTRSQLVRIALEQYRDFL
jgi:two-component system nitrate/nitrite response regulator NarL